jgi:hypothetical protein
MQRKGVALGYNPDTNPPMATTSQNLAGFLLAKISATGAYWLYISENNLWKFCCNRSSTVSSLAVCTP